LKGKEAILDEIQDVIAPPKKLDLKYLLYTYLVVCFVVALAFFKIYVHQQIYYESRRIAKLRAERDMLREEHKAIKASVESIRFKNQISDTIFDN